MKTVAPEDLASREMRQQPESLSPPLQRALQCLPVNLDEELVRYRRAIHGQGSIPSRNRLGRRRRQSLDLINVTAHSPVSTPTEDTPRGNKAGTALSLVEEQPPLTPGSLVPSSNASPAAANPDYLESTAALLSLGAMADGQSDAQPETEEYSPSLAQRLSTPLGLGALLLLLIGCSSLGFLATNPRVLQHLWQHPTLQALRGTSEPGPASADLETAPNALDSDGAPFEGIGPDLSQREFSDLDLNDLSTLPTESPTFLSNPKTETGVPDQVANSDANQDRNTATSRSATATIPEPQTASRQRQTPQPPPAQAATSTPATAPPQPSTAPKPTAPASDQSPGDPAYYVVTSYTGDQSLAEARRIVGDAYVRNFPEGARIQMGAFDQENSAQTLLNQLQSQGLPAQIYEAK